MAASVGPYGAFLHNGSEYTGAYAEEMSIEVSGFQLLIRPKYKSCVKVTDRKWRQPKMLDQVSKSI